MDRADFKSYELQKLINTIYEAVDKSVVGPFFQDPSNLDTCKTLAMHTYLSLLSSLVPKNVMGIDMTYTENKEKLNG